MTVIIDQPDLKAALSRVRPATGKYPANMVKLEPDEGNEALVLTGADYSLRVCTIVPAREAELASDVWPVYLPIRHLSVFTNNLDKAARITISAEDKLVTIRSGVDRFEVSHDALHGTDPVAGPPLEAEVGMSRPDRAVTWSAPGGTLAAMRAVLPAVSRDDYRPVLTQVHLDPDGEAVTTDSYRLMVVKCATPGERLGIPARLVRAIPKDADEALITYDEVNMVGGFLEFACDNGTTVQHRGHSLGEFPNYQSLLPNRKIVALELDRDHAIAQMKMLAGWGGNDVNPGRFIWDGEGVEWSHKTNWDGDTLRVGRLNATDRQPVSPAITVGFNPWYFLDGLRSIPSPVIHWDMVDNLKPFVLSDPEGTHRYLLMPVRMS